MKSDDLLLGVAVVAIIVSVVGLSVTYNSVTSFEDILTGFASTELGFVNVSLSSNAVINISSAAGDAGSDAINWSGGSVDSLANHATLDTSGGGSVTNGTWPSQAGGFLIDNIGNVNVTLSISSDKVAQAFLDGSSPYFQYNLSDSLSGSCTAYVSGFNSSWKEFTETPVEACTSFIKNTDHDQLRLDIKLVIPADAPAGDKGAQVTLTYDAV